LSNPHAPAHLAADVAEPLLPIKAVRLQSVVAEHLQHLCVFLPLLLKDQLALVAFVVVLAAPAVLATLSLVLRHLPTATLEDERHGPRRERTEFDQE
jgi:hypothetical protein